MKNTLRLAMPTNIYDSIPLTERFRKIASFGVRNIMLCSEKELTEENAAEASKDFFQLGLSCVQVKSLNMPKSYVSEAHFDEAIAEIKKIRGIAKIYGAAQIELTAGSFRGKKEKHIKAAVKFISEACGIAEEEGMCCALDFTPKKNQLIKTWAEMAELYEKVGKENLLINVNTALLHHFEVSEEELEFIEGKSALIEIEDIEDDGWNTGINIGEGIADITAWVEKSKPYILETCEKTGSCPTALIVFKNDDDVEIKRTFRYLERALPNVRM